MSQENTRERRRLKAEGNVHGLRGDGCHFEPKFKGCHGKGGGVLKTKRKRLNAGGGGR